MHKKETISVDGIRYLLYTVLKQAWVIDIENKEMENLVIPPSVSFQGLVFDVATIEHTAFRGCENLASVTLPRSLTSISNLFYACHNLASVTLPETVKKIGRDAFVDCPMLDLVQSINSVAFRDCINLKSITFPDGLTSIGDYAFCGCTGLTSVVIPNSVKGIGSGALSGCRRLRSAMLPPVNPEYIDRIKHSVFDECPNVAIRYSKEGYMEFTGK